MVTWIKNKIKKFIGMDIELLMSYKDNFQGQKFQLVKGKGPRLGKVARVVDVDFNNRNQIVVTFEDGHVAPAAAISENYMMIMDDQPPMSMAEVQSINGEVVSSAEEMDAIAPGLEVPEEFKVDVIVPPVNRAVQQPAQQQPPRPTQPVNETDLFGMFALEETNLNLSVLVKLPNRSLLKAMYQNSQNQADFINKLSIYINNSVTADSIKDSLWKMLDPDKKKKLNDKSS